MGTWSLLVFTSFLIIRGCDQLCHEIRLGLPYTTWYGQPFPQCHKIEYFNIEIVSGGSGWERVGSLTWAVMRAPNWVVGNIWAGKWLAAPPHFTPYSTHKELTHLVPEESWVINGKIHDIINRGKYKLILIFSNLT